MSFDRHNNILYFSICCLVQKDELLWAAAWLYKATGEKKYITYVIRNQGWSQAVNEFSWDSKFAGAQALLASVSI